MTEPIDIYRTASALIKEHGKRADLYAAVRADKLLEAGDMDGRGVWLRVLQAVEELSSKEPPKGTALH